jgi:hypothetical protein
MWLVAKCLRTCAPQRSTAGYLRLRLGSRNRVSGNGGALHSARRDARRYRERDLYGRDSAQAWARLASDLDISKLEGISQVIGLSQVISSAQALMDGKVRGRVVVDVEM